MEEVLRAVGLDEILALKPFGGTSVGDVVDVLAGFGRFAAEVLAPTDRVGDVVGARFDPETASVTLPPELRDAYTRWVGDGWAGLAVDAAHGGGGLPAVVGLAADEMFVAANMALSLNPMLTQGAIHLLQRWGSDEQRSRYLANLVTGRWSGTMVLTEPDAGSDVGAVRTRATPRGDGTWAISGTKIFITWGEHDLAENIVHAVLARTPGAPPGTKGISLFLVPRRLVGSDGSLGERNSVRCVGIEHKLGIHASPTCVLDFDEAIGELVGDEHGGMTAMFTMMNAARLAVGVEGLALSERAYQQALAYAQQRRQGRAVGAPQSESSPIVEHPDVRRMLLTIVSSVDAMRALLYTTAAAADRARHLDDADARDRAAARVDLLTPMAKAWCTDEGIRNTSLALQVHGGMGYIEETGIAQRFRDSRIAAIYEGTNGIQAIDLTSRKVLRDKGAALGDLLDEIDGLIAQLVHDEQLAVVAVHLEAAVAAVRSATSWLVDAADDPDQWMAAATPYLELVSTTVAGGLLARVARWVRDHGDAERARAITGRARFFAIERLAPAAALLTPITSGADRLRPELLA